MSRFKRPHAPKVWSKRFWIGGRGTGAQWFGALASLFVGIIALVVASISNKTARNALVTQIELEMRPLIERDYNLNRDPIPGNTLIFTKSVPFRLTNIGKSTAWDFHFAQWPCSSEVMGIVLSDKMQTSSGRSDFYPGMVHEHESDLLSPARPYLNSIDMYRMHIPQIESEDQNQTVTYISLRTIRVDAKMSDSGWYPPLWATHVMSKEFRFQGMVMPCSLRFNGNLSEVVLREK